MIRRPIAALVAVVIAVVGLPTAAAPAADGSEAGSLVLSELREEATQSGTVPVLVSVADRAGADPAAVVAELAGGGATAHAVSERLVAVDADAAGLDRLAAAAAIEAIGADPILRTAADPGGGADLRADTAHLAGNSGVGRRVAVIDTGVDASHPALAAAVVAEACFLGDLGGRCPNGQPTQVGPGAGAPCAGSISACGHGTHVAGIVAGRPTNALGPGVAPGAELISVRIFDTDPSASGQVAARTGDLIAALSHLQVLDRTTPIDAINLSISGEALYDGYCDGAPLDPAVQELGRIVNELRAAGVATVAATGNGGSTSLIAFPACLSGVVRVTATSGDELAPFANRNPLVSLAAPGVDIASAAPGGGNELRSGTSMATPHVTGAIALLRQRYDADVSWLVDRLAGTGHPVVDPASGLTYARVDAAAALGLAPTSVGAPVPAAGAWVVTNTGRVLTLGAARQHGNQPRLNAGEQVVAASATRTGLGYWLVTDRGRVIAYGDAAELGDVRALPLNKPITAMATTTSGRGYWLLGADGGIFTFGDAAFRGSTGAMPLNAPVTDLAATPSGGGYWLTARDGGVFAFGDAGFHGSTGNLRLNQPVVSIAPGTAGGYWLVALDGGVFAFDVPFLGSLPGSGIVDVGYRLRVSAASTGYHVLTTGGWVRPYGRAVSFGQAAVPSSERAVDLLMLP